MTFENTKAHNRGLAIGAAVISAFGAAWALGAVLKIPAPASWLVYLPVLAGVALVVPSVYLAITARGSQARDAISAAQEGRHAGMWFGIIFTLEGVFIAIAAILLSSRHLADWIPVATAFIVGIHFLPLARVFRVPVYYLTGILASAAALACLAIADPITRVVFVCIAMAAILWFSAIAALMQARRSSQ